MGDNVGGWVRSVGGDKMSLSDEGEIDNMSE